MTRIVSYNILAGGYSLRENGARRTDQLVQMIQSANPDIVGVVEATNPVLLKQKPLVVEEMAEQLGMQLIMGGDPTHLTDYQTALLTRLPIISTQIHPRPGLLNKPLLEVHMREENGQELTVFVTHLSAAFYQGWAGNGLREREVEEILNITRTYREQNIPHLIMGDFNSLAPGDRFKASNLLRYVVQLDEEKKEHQQADGHPHLNFVVPKPLRIFNPLLRIIPRSILLTSLFDMAASFYAPRGSIRKLLKGGYQDSFRHANPYANGFTCPAAAPAGRIDYIFSSSALIERLESCYELTEGEGVKGSQASDHLPVAAEFGIGVELEEKNNELKSAMIG